MMRWHRLSVSRPRRRNLLAATIASGVLGLLYLQLQRTAAPLAADEAGVDVERLSAKVPVTEAGEAGLDLPVSQVPVSDRDHAQSTVGPTDSEAARTVLSGRLALLMNLLMLERAHALLEKTPSYTATFFKQERVGDELTEGTVMRMKLRHKPFSVYLKWLTGDRGRELIYAGDRYDGKMIVHVGGWKARLLPTVKLDPEGSTAMRESRHPVTQIGLMEVARRGIAHRRRDLKATGGVHCRMIDGCRFDDRDCWCFVIEYDDEFAESEYRKTVVFMDKQYLLPVCVKNYDKPQEPAPTDPAALDEQTLLEAYSYTDIDLEAALTDADFDRHNEQYLFR